MARKKKVEAIYKKCTNEECEEVIPEKEVNEEGLCPACAPLELPEAPKGDTAPKNPKGEGEEDLPALPSPSENAEETTTEQLKSAIINLQGRLTTVEAYLYRNR